MRWKSTTPAKLTELIEPLHAADIATFWNRISASSGPRLSGFMVP